MNSRITHLLQKSEKYFKTDMTYVARGGFWLAMGQLFATASVLLLSVIFANFFPKESYGTYKYILSIASILGAISLTGMSSIVVQSVARGEDAVLRLAVRENLRWGKFIILTAIILASYYYYLQDNLLLALSILIAGSLIPVTISFGLFGSYLNGKKKFRESTLYWIFSQCFNVCGLIIGIFLTENVLILIGIYFATNAISSIFFYFFTIRTSPPNETGGSDIILFGKHISLMNFFGTLANQLDKVLVFHFLGATNLAIYAFSIAIPEQIKGGFKSLFGLALPKYAELEVSKLRTSIIKKTLMLSGIASLIALAYIIIAPYIFQVFFPAYTDSVFYSQVYILGIITIPGISLFATYFQVRKDTKTMYKLSIIGNTATIIFSFVLIKHFGILGAVIENSVSWLVMLLSHLFYFIREKRAL